jgi:hypothetical protein
MSRLTDPVLDLILKMNMALLQSNSTDELASQIKSFSGTRALNKLAKWQKKLMTVNLAILPFLKKQVVS